MKPTIFLMQAEEEEENIPFELKIFREYKRWKSLRETTGMWRIAPLSDPHFSQPQNDRHREWRDIVSQIYTESIGRLFSFDYDKLLYISPERKPAVKKSFKRIVQRRKGLGNLILDLGGPELRDEVDLADSKAHYGAHLDDMTAYQFKGRILMPVLERLIPEGGTAAIYTVQDRVHDLAKVCSLPEVGDIRATARQNVLSTLEYKGRKLVLVKRDSLEAILQHRASLS